MSSDAWDQIQEIKIKRNSLREKLEKRKKERQDILLGSSNLVAASSLVKSESTGSEDKKPVLSNIKQEIGILDVRYCFPLQTIIVFTIFQILILRLNVNYYKFYQITLWRYQ